MPKGTREPVYAPVVRVALGLFRALDVDFTITGAENVPTTGGGVVVMNHTGYLDFALAGVPFWKAKKRLVRFMAKDQVFKNPVSGPLMRGMKHIPVDRTAGADAYAAAVGALKRGELVGVFPEATISRSFCLKEFKSGAARMAAEAGVPLYPMVLWGSQRIWTKGRKRSLMRNRHVPVSISLAPPLHVEPGEAPDVTTKRLLDVMQGLLDDAVAAYPVKPAGEDDRWWMPAHLGGTAPTREQAGAMDAEEAAARLAAKRAKGAS
ncbi:MAG TPA: lysophospholipid acyltransferase family protein [Mycobacteriales bacterium]|nr:lysophospholipid acyltransferase family protein [Mycobacteriales bacterium]